VYCRCQPAFKSWRGAFNAQLCLWLGILAAFLVVLPIHVKNASADVAVRIMLSTQTMHVEVDGTPYATWAVSTAQPGYRTPAGIYKPYALDRMHYSRLYDYTPMPYSIFFLRGYAIHATTEVSNLGRPASHGCVRLRLDNAKALFDLVSHHGLQSTSISVIE
jgi:lipoprotein-anchoring transpeptidase ErfK/SrfK